ncbi:MAG: Rab family GTPase [Promethearchaeota archaeon]
MMQQIVFKILIAGDASVGKTTLLHRYVNGKFIDSTTMTIGVNFLTKRVNFNDNIICNLQLWDIGGQDRFRFMVDNYLRGAHGALLLFDVTNMTSFVNIQKWWQLLRKKNDRLPIILVGTKYDLEEFSIVGDYYAELTKKKLGMINYIKTSSKWGLNIENVFNILLKHLINLKYRKPDYQPTRGPFF